MLCDGEIGSLLRNRLNLAQPPPQLANLPPLLAEIAPQILEPTGRARQPQQPRHDPSPRGALQRTWSRVGLELELGPGFGFGFGFG